METAAERATAVRVPSPAPPPHPRSVGRGQDKDEAPPHIFGTRSSRAGLFLAFVSLPAVLVGVAGARPACWGAGLGYSCNIPTSGPYAFRGWICNSRVAVRISY